MSDTSLSTPAPSIKNEMSVNSPSLPTVTINGVNSIYLIPQTSQPLFCNVLPNPLPLQTFPGVSTAPQFVMNSPILAGNSANPSVFGTLCLPTNSMPTYTGHFQQYVNVSYQYTGVVPQVQPQACVNLNSAAPILLLPDASPPSSNAAINDAITCKAPPSTTVTSTVLPSLYPNVSLNKCDVKVNATSGTPSSTAPVMVMPAVPPPPYSTASWSNCQVKVEPTIESMYVNSAPGEAQPPLAECSKVFDMSELMSPINDEMYVSEAEELTVEVDPSNFLHSSDTDSPEKCFPICQAEKPEYIAYQPVPTPSTSWRRCFYPFWKKANPLPIQSCPMRKSEESNVQILHGKNSQPGYNVQQSKPYFPPYRSNTSNVSQKQLGLNGKSKARNSQIHSHSKSQLAVNVSKPFNSVGKGSKRGMHYQFPYLPQTNSQMRQISSPLQPVTASLSLKKASSDGISKSNPSQNLVKSGQIWQSCSSDDNGLPTGYFFVEQRPLQNFVTVMPRIPIVSRIRIPVQGHCSRPILPSMARGSSDVNSPENSKCQTRNIPEHRIEFRPSADIHEQEICCPEEVVVTSLDFPKFNYNEHNYCVRLQRHSVNKTRNSCGSTAVLQRIVPIRCHVALKRLHPSHFEGMTVNLKNVLEKDLFNTKTGRQSSRLKEQKPHWRKNRKFRVQSSPLPRVSKSSKGKRQRKAPRKAVVEDSVKAETPSVKKQDVIPPPAHSQLSNYKRININDSEVAIRQLKRRLVVRLHKL